MREDSKAEPVTWPLSIEELAQNDQRSAWFLHEGDINYCRLCDSFTNHRLLHGVTAQLPRGGRIAVHGFGTVTVTGFAVSACLHIPEMFCSGLSVPWLRIHSQEIVWASDRDFTVTGMSPELHGTKFSDQLCLTSSLQHMANPTVGQIHLIDLTADLARIFRDHDDSRTPPTAHPGCAPHTIVVEIDGDEVDKVPPSHPEWLELVQHKAFVRKYGQEAQDQALKKGQRS